MSDLEYFDCDECGKNCGEVYSLDGHYFVCSDCRDEFPLDEKIWFSQVIDDRN